MGVRNRPRPKGDAFREQGLKGAECPARRAAVVKRPRVTRLEVGVIPWQCETVVGFGGALCLGIPTSEK